jgi:hypothetical protein
LTEALQECVDARGDVWITQAASSAYEGGNAVEYAHGGTTMLNEVATDQPPGSCSVSPDGDLAIQDSGDLSASGELGPGEVQIWKNGLRASRWRQGADSRRGRQIHYVSRRHCVGRQIHGH